MAYKRSTTKTGPNSRRSVTYNTNGPTTVSTSSTANGVTYTSTSKGGKYYMTRTQKFAGGYVDRKRIMSSSPKKTSTKRRKGDDKVGVFGVVLLFFIALVGSVFGG